MFELPELKTLARQINGTLAGKRITEGRLGNVKHKFVWYNRGPEEFARLTLGKAVGEARAQGKWLFVPLVPGYVLLFGECGGKMLYHSSGTKPPAKYHLCLTFDDGSFFSVTTQMWGAMELYEAGREKERKYVKGMRPTPADPEFTFRHFDSLLDSEGKKRSAKGLLTQDQLIPGLGNSIAQDILFLARLHPRHPVDELNQGQRRSLFNAITKTVQAIARRNGRYDEYDLFGRSGQYIRLMDKEALARPCPECSGPIQKLAYLGGACYFCPNCQK